MSTVAPTTASNDNLYASLGLGVQTEAASDALDQQDFLRLMTVQMQSQDPLKPMENAEFFSQIAQFSTVSGIADLQSTMTTLSSQLTSGQSLEAAALIGHDVLVASNVGVLGSEGMNGAIDVPISGAVKLEIRDTSGAVVRTVSLGTQAAGQIAFSWDGTDAEGNPLPEGLYEINATVEGTDMTMAAPTYAADNIQSVSVVGGDLNVELAQLGELPFSYVMRIQ